MSGALKLAAVSVRQGCLSVALALSRAHEIARTTGVSHAASVVVGMESLVCLVSGAARD